MSSLCVDGAHTALTQPAEEPQAPRSLTTVFVEDVE